MATSREVANRALELAHAFVAAHRDELAELAAYQRDVLIGAQGRLRESSVSAHETERADEHIAFALLAAAWEATLH